MLKQLEWLLIKDLRVFCSWELLPRQLSLNNNLAGAIYNSDGSLLHAHTNHAAASLVLLTGFRKANEVKFSIHPCHPKGQKNTLWGLKKEQSESHWCFLLVYSQHLLLIFKCSLGGGKRPSQCPILSRKSDLLQYLQSCQCSVTRGCFLAAARTAVPAWKIL